MACRRGVLKDEVIGKQNEALRDMLMKDVASSVTLKDGWRKVLLPSLDIRTKQNSNQVSACVSP